MAHIPDETLDRLSAELMAMARDVGNQQHFNDDLRKAARDFSVDLYDLAMERPRLALFAELLSRHATRESALAELISQPA